MRLAVALFAGAWLVLAASAYGDGSNDAERLSGLMIGSYQTSPDDPDNDFVDTRVSMVPLGPGYWVYYQLNTGADRVVYRQRVLQFTDKPDGGVLQTTWSLKEPERIVVQPSASSMSQDLSMEDLVPALEDGCDQHWRYDEEVEGGPWVGLVDPDTCKIFSESRQDKIAIKAEARLSAETLYQTEKGFDATGAQLFGGPDGEFIILYRQN